MLLGIDLGTSSLKASLFRPDGELVASSLIPYETERDGGAQEQDPMAWEGALRKAIAIVITAGSPVAMAVTAQMSGLLLLDQEGDPVMPALPWSDRRAETEAEYLAQMLGAEALYQQTGCRQSAGYPAAKIAWVKSSRPDWWAATRRIGGAKEYLVARLTGEWVTDPSCAGASQLFGLQTGTWWQPMLDLLGINANHLPTVAEPWAPAGVTGGWAASLGLPMGIPVAVGAGDGACSSWGAGALEPGDVVVSAGTSGVVRVLAEQPLLHPAAATTCYPLGGGQWAGTGVTTAAGGALEWVAGLLGLSGVGALEELAAAAPPGAGGVSFLPDLNGSRTPHWEPGARGGFTGLDLSAKREHVARAAVEGVAFSLVSALDALTEAGARPHRLLLTGGGSQNRLLAGTLAGITGHPTFEALGGDAARGAAQLAAVTAGLFPDLGAARAAMAPRLLSVPPISVPTAAAASYRNTARALRPGNLGR